MRRIAFLLDALKVGGAQRHTLDLAVRLLERGDDVHLVVYSKVVGGLALPPALVDRTIQLDFHKVLDRRGAAAVAEALARTGAEVVVAVNQAPTILAALTRLAGAKGRFVSILHTTVLMPGLWDTRRFWLYRLALLAMHRLVYVSRNQMAYWRERRLLCRGSEAIPNGVDLARYDVATSERRTAERQKLGFSDEDFVIGLCATFRAEKNHVQLVDAVVALRARGIPARLLFVGDGETRAATESHVAACGLTEHVLFAGSQNDVRPYLVAIDVGVLCSTAVETFSIAALEVMAMGHPMVMSDIGGASEIVREGVDGALFPAGDTAALIEALARLADRETCRRAGIAARDGVVSRYSEEIMLARYADLFDGLVGAPDRGGHHLAGAGRSSGGTL